MESEQDRFNRHLFPSLVPRSIAITVVATALAWAHAQIRPHVLAYISGIELKRMYLTVTSTILMGPAIVGIMGSVVGYFYYLRNRQIHTSLSETGLAGRSIAAGLLGFVAVGVVFVANYGW